MKIVGMGPGSPDQLTRLAEKTLLEAPRLVLRTARHGVAAYLREQGKTFETLDACYKQANTMEDAVEAVVKRLQELESQGEVVYGVPGSGTLAEDSVAALLARGVEADIVPGLSAGDAGLAACKAAPPAVVQLPASRLDARQLNSRLPLLVTQLDDPLLAGEVKLQLTALWPEETPAVLVTEGKAYPLALYELDRQTAFAPESCLYLPAMEDGQGRYSYGDLVCIMDVLRGPGGCPWDIEQTHESLRENLLEEACEVIDAINRQDEQELCAELGDVLLQVVFHAQIAQAEGYFDILDVTDGICRKMILRHPHIFGEASADTAEEVVTNWDAIKRRERGQKTVTETLAEVPRTLPALMRARKVQSRASKAGFEWPYISLAQEKLMARLHSLMQEIHHGDAVSRERAAGEVLLAVTDLIRMAKVEPELALDGAIDRFIETFAQVEKLAAAESRDLQSFRREEWMEMWRKSKKQP